MDNATPQNGGHKQRIAELEARVTALVEENERLRARIEELERELRRDSGNSGKPPSSDTVTQRQQQNEERLSRAERRRRARAKAKELLRREREAKRRPGKQPGSEGKHLEMVADPDAVVVWAPEGCDSCGSGLSSSEVVSVERRQVFELPETALSVTEHRAESRRCSCGQVTQGAFPAEAGASVSYGARMHAAACYLLSRQHLPVERCAELLRDLLGAPVSAGWLAGVPGKGARGLSGFLAEVRAALRGAEVVHVDETGARIAGTRHWFHDVCTPALTLIDCHPKRGREATDDMGVLPGFTGVAVHDRWRTYLTYNLCEHALCNAHLVRDLAAVSATPSQREWSEAMADLLVEAKVATDEAAGAGAATLPGGVVASIWGRYDELVAAALAANPDPVGRKRNATERASYNLARAFAGHKNEILRFTLDLRVPFDNNEAERGVRMIKLQQKISGCFRTLQGARAFCALRSYLQTAAKNEVNLLEALTRLFAGDPWMPAEARGP